MEYVAPVNPTIAKKYAGEINMIKNDIIDYLYQKIPELYDYAAYIEEHSNGEATLVIYDDYFGEATEIIDNQGTRHMCNVIYVGEKHSDHTVNWDYFYVDISSGEIFWWDIVSEKPLTLDGWRQSDLYHSYK